MAGRRRAAIRGAIAILIGALLLPLLPGVKLPFLGAGTDTDTSAIGDDVGATAIDRISGLLGSIAPSTAEAFTVETSMTIGIVGTGIDTSILPEAVRPRISQAGASGDALGHATWAASVILQQAPSAAVVSERIYSGTRLDPALLRQAVLEMAANPEVDAILLAFPPADLLDPVTAAMATSDWAATLEALGDSNLSGPAGQVFGIPLDPGLRATQLASLPPAQREAASRFAEATSRWNELLAMLASIEATGVPVVSPAGDTGPGPQSVVGLAGLPDVITVAAVAGDGVAPDSAAGPSFHGTPKPDLLAPATATGLLPPKSVLGNDLAARGVLDPLLPTDLPGVPAPTAARTAVAGTVPSAATVAITAASLRAEGVHTVEAIRGLLVAAAHPVAGIPVWRQGAGVITGSPVADDLAARTVVGGSLDLGLEPAAGSPWESAVPVVGSAPTGLDTVLTDRVATTGAAGRVGTPVEAAEEPPVAVSVTDGGVTVSLPAGDNTWRAGVFCGYTTMTVPTTGTPLSPALTIEGAPADLEHVPTCLAEGATLEAWNFYIHDLPAENLTFALLPAPVPGKLIGEGPLHLLPVNPLHTPLFMAVSGPDGFARFTNVPPSYYLLRQHADYGTPTSEGQPGINGAAAAPLQRDLGQEFGYMSYDALTLDNPCPDSMKDHAATGTPCHEEWLSSQPGVTDVSYDKVHARYLVTIVGGQTIGVVFEFTKKMQGANVAGRYVDFVDGSDYVPVSAGIPDVPLADVFSDLGLGRVSDAWELSPSVGDGDAEGMDATFRGLPQPEGKQPLIGMIDYEFALPTPNYTGSLSLNFKWQAERATIVVGVLIGQQLFLQAFSNAGTVDIPLVKPGSAPYDIAALAALGRGSGVANLERSLLLQGVDHGLLRFAFLSHDALVPARASVNDVSFEITTWTNTPWPPTRHDRDADPATGPGGLEAPGHAFRFDSGISERQFQGRCRDVADAGRQALMCENWHMLLSSGVDDVETFDLVDSDTGERFISTAREWGGAYYHPHRGTKSAVTRLAFAGDVASVHADASVARSLATNGRFWEQLAIPAGALLLHPGLVDVLIEDNRVGGSSPRLPHADGPAPLDPYLRFVNSHSHVASPVPDPAQVPETVGWLGDDAGDFVQSEAGEVLPMVAASASSPAPAPVPPEVATTTAFACSLA